MILVKVLTVFQVLVPLVCDAAKARLSSVDPLSGENPCAPNPCLNDGLCIASVDTDLGYFCKCGFGFHGQNCNETDPELTLASTSEVNLTSMLLDLAQAAEIDPICDPNPCQNTGRCVPDKSTETGYVCHCMMGWAGQTCEEAEVERHLRVVPSHEEVSESRSLNSDTDSQWACLKDGYAVDAVSIWWGHTSAHGAWACNNWISYCGGACTASTDKISAINWYCYGVDPIIYIGQHRGSAVDKLWGKVGCTLQYLVQCATAGGCLPKATWYSDGYKRYNTFIKCSGNGGACNVIQYDPNKKPITLNRFSADKTDDKVYGCDGFVKFDGLSLSGKLEKEPSAEISLSFGFEDSFLGWEGCCAVAGEAMQSRGYLSDGWFCEKDLLNTGIWLKGKAWK